MSVQHSIQRVMSGEAHGLGPATLRGALSIAEPFYRSVVQFRNRRFDRAADRIRRLPRPVISIGNLTTGGTGKTPIVRWLADRLRQEGLTIGILSRGYKATSGMLGDEQLMLQALLGEDKIHIAAHPDRFSSGMRLLESYPGIHCFLLDDAFQHRRLARDFDLVLLHAEEPFGFGHVLPRGLMREPPAGLSRADAVILTHVSSSDGNESTIGAIRRWNATCPIYSERHEAVGFRRAGTLSDKPVDLFPTDLRPRRVYCFSGLGSPGGFEDAVRKMAGTFAGARRFPDHHAYSEADIAFVRGQATHLAADVLVTTEKDWVKLAPLDSARTGTPEILRLDIEAKFTSADESALLERVICVIRRTPGRA